MFCSEEFFSRYSASMTFSIVSPRRFGFQFQTRLKSLNLHQGTEYRLLGPMEAALVLKAVPYGEREVSSD